MEYAAKCKRCGNAPMIISSQGMYYIKCTKCGMRSVVAKTKELSVSEWNSGKFLFLNTKRKNKYGCGFCSERRTAAGIAVKDSEDKSRDDYGKFCMHEICPFSEEFGQYKSFNQYVNEEAKKYGLKKPRFGAGKLDLSEMQ